MTKELTFETTYTRYPFAPLVAFGIAVADAIQRIGGKLVRPREDAARHQEAKGAVGHAA